MFISGVNDTGDKLFGGVNDRESCLYKPKNLKFIAGVNDTAEKLFSGVNDTSEKFFGGVSNTGD
jgi:hypothetical protein